MFECIYSVKIIQSFSSELKLELWWISTVKASNFGPHGNFDLFSRMACYPQSTSYGKRKKIKDVEKY
jgi:hypothetical protein